MKEATGEFSMTVVVILAVVAIAGIIAVLKDPITNYIKKTFIEQSDAAINEVGQ